MAGMRIGGSAIMPSLSLPYIILEENLGESDGCYNVWRVINGTPTRITPFDAAGGFPGNPTGPWSEPQENPRLSPNGQYVAYETYWESSGYGLIQVCDAIPGGTVIDMTPDAGPGSEGSYRLYPSWDPTSSKIVYTRSIDGGFAGDIYEVELSNPGTENLLWAADRQGPPQRDGAYRPQYNFDGTKIAFIFNVDPGGGGTVADQGLWVMDSDGSNAALIDQFNGGNAGNDGYGYSGTQFAWGNLGDYLVYSTNGFGTYGGDVYAINADGTGKTQLNVSNGSGWRIGHGAWVADDTYVIGTYFDAGFWNPWRLELDGVTPETLLNGSQGPDGDQYFQCVYRNPQTNRLEFVASRNPGQVWSMAIDGTDAMMIHEIADPPAESSLFFNGTGFEWI